MDARPYRRGFLGIAGSQSALEEAGQVFGPLLVEREHRLWDAAEIEVGLPVDNGVL